MIGKWRVAKRPKPCGQAACDEVIDAGERHIRLYPLGEGGPSKPFHIECAQIEVGRDANTALTASSSALVKWADRPEETP
jgi:hypothetical protein